MSVVLIGYRGSGKTTVGRKLADRLWQPFVDVDERIVTAAGKSVKEIFEQDGEPAYRDRESAVLADVIEIPSCVIALGGGTLDREANRALLSRSGHRVIYLRCDPEELLRRVKADPQSAAHRPNLTNLGGDIEEIRAVLDRREPIYRSVLHAELDVTHLSPEEMVVHVARMV